MLLLLSRVSPLAPINLCNIEYFKIHNSLGSPVLSRMEISVPLPFRARSSNTVHYFIKFTWPLNNNGRGALALNGMCNRVKNILVNISKIISIFFDSPNGDRRLVDIINCRERKSYDNLPGLEIALFSQFYI